MAVIVTARAVSRDESERISESCTAEGTPSNKNDRKFLPIFGEQEWMSSIARHKVIIWGILTRFTLFLSYLAGLTNPYTLILSGPYWLVTKTRY